jgi:hypothetical protein
MGVLTVIGFLGGRFAQSWPTAVAATVTVTIGFSISGATSTQADGLWPVGSFLVFVGTATGMAVATLLGSLARGSADSHCFDEPGTDLA